MNVKCDYFLTKFNKTARECTNIAQLRISEHNVLSENFQLIKNWPTESYERVSLKKMRLFSKCLRSQSFIYIKQKAASVFKKVKLE